jgi:FkbM family methyltransferase
MQDRKKIIRERIDFMRSAKKLIKNVLKNFDIGITRHSTLKKLLHNSSAAHDIEVLQRLNNTNAQQLLHYFGKSKSQLRQDLFVLSHLSFKRNGYFVEFGATNGYDLSNTYLMEKEFGWSGILAEPATVWKKDLKNNRNCNIETDCVWKESNSTLTFRQTTAVELSTIDSYSETDLHKDARNEGKTYSVKTISLIDLLTKYNAPAHIDYLSIDTEGSEYEILNSFDFSKYTFSVITCEHNYTLMREKLYSLLTRQGYKRVFENLSLFDDWYVRSTPQKP